MFIIPNLIRGAIIQIPCRSTAFERSEISHDDRCKEIQRGRFSRVLGKLLRDSSESLPEPAPDGASSANVRTTERTRKQTPPLNLPGETTADGNPADPSTSQRDDRKLGPIRWDDLWKEAFRAFEREDEDSDLGIMKDYKKYLGNQFNQDVALNDILQDSKNVESIVKQLERRRDDKQYRLRYSSSLVNFDINIREQGEKLLRFAMWSDTLVKEALTTQPYASLAWCGATMVLPVSRLTLTSAEYGR